MRTCYAAMRHMEGDIIRPRDCVLLRAGSKRNELPYVAKVAHLWENPEDGEWIIQLEFNLGWCSQLGADWLVRMGPSPGVEMTERPRRV